MGMCKERFAKVATLVGVHLLTAPSSFLWNYGNLSAYMESYFHVFCFPGCVDGDSQWIINLYVASFCPGLCLSRPLCNYLGMRWSGIVAMIICNAGLISSAWSIKVSVMGTSLLMGLLCGLGTGTSLCTAFMYVNAWVVKNKGLFVATVTSAPTILSILQNQMITMYVNPKNLKPDTAIGPKTYFSDLALLKRVPNIVFILGLMTFVLQLLGNILVSDPPSTPKTTSTDKTQKSIILKNGTYDTKSALEPDGEKTKDIEIATATTEQLPRPLKALEVLKTGSFKALWLYVVALMYGLILKNNYYKQFGLLYIENDKFLTLVGSLIPVTASITRIAFGGLLDRNILSIKDCMIITLSVNSLLCDFWWFAPQVNGLFYMILILSMASMHSVTYTLAATGTLQVFGPANFATNFALVYTAATVTSIVTALTVNPLLQALGWFWLFTSCGIVSGVALFSTIVINMEKKET
ncbi:hypothetical protein EGW08_015845 [Elysia chlorotica]|uniref:Major facilitator superfamily (MFS) profile domain-containing protein n=1 Tax=Elysia chlorotica TaxID=188477 RepID=A0A433T4D1_ELYCH|nr:hypothetical protein EGW08_015845 [Elysia chlorotica]